ncbi:ribonuclease H-like domain-containing protein [Tanacetum coccineum]
MIKKAQKTSLVAQSMKNNEKALLNILLSAIPDNIFSVSRCCRCKTFRSAINASLEVMKHHKKMQKESFVTAIRRCSIGSREELDSAYERFQHILSMLELYDAKVSQEDANLKFLRSLPSVWHVVATMIRGQLEGGSTLKQSIADPDNISKGYTQATSSKVKTAPNYDSHSDEIICSFFSQQASMPTTHDDEDLLQIDEDAMEEIDIRWQVAMITARIRKFMRKTGRPIDLKPKNGITFDKSKIECFNCQKLGHFARECRFAKYQENKANGRNEKRIVAISSTEAEYVAAASCCAQVLWMQNQLLDYGFNFMNTEIHIDNESTICIVKNPVFHSKTKHIQIRHHFIRDCYEQRLISIDQCLCHTRTVHLLEVILMFIKGFRGRH